jgi:hypothetical protein
MPGEKKPIPIEEARNQDNDNDTDIPEVVEEEEEDTVLKNYTIPSGLAGYEDEIMEVY